jgi:uncharacterized protein (DUF1697 family)
VSGTNRRQHVAFIRAINVGRANRITMTRLVELVSDTGCTNVRSFQATGNLVFDAPARRTREQTSIAIEERLFEAGLRKTDAMVWTVDELQSLVATDPFAGVAPDDAHRCVCPLRYAPIDQSVGILTNAGMTVVHMDDRVACVLAPRLPGGPTATALIERAWKVPTTTRWWNVMCDFAASVEATD